MTSRSKAKGNRGLRLGPLVEWRACVGFPDYMVSEFGDLMRVTKGRTRHAGHQPIGQLQNGYRSYKLMAPDGSKAMVRAHRLVVEAFKGPAPTDLHQVAHWDGDPLNNHVSNLRWATVAENAADKIRHGRSSRGVKNNKARLEPGDVRKIRQMKREGVSGYRIAKRYGLGSTTVYQVLNGKTWSHVR